MIVLQLRDLRNIIRESLIISSSRGIAASDRGGNFGDSRISLACSSPVNLQQIAADWPVNCLGGCARRKSSAAVTSFAWLSLFFMSTNLYVFSLQTEHECKHKQQFVFVRQYTGTKKKNEVLCNLNVHISAKLDQENVLRKGEELNDTALRTQDSKFEPYRSEAEQATSRSRRLPTIL